MNIPREAVSALAHKLRNGDWNLRAPQELADMIASELDALSEHGAGGETMLQHCVAGAALSGVSAPVGVEDHVRRQVGRLAQWSKCMSHNESYFGEPAGLVKSVTEELAHAVDPIYPPIVPPPDPLAGVTIHTATVTFTTPPPAPAAIEFDKVASDALQYGTGVMLGDKHVPHDQVFAPAAEQGAIVADVAKEAGVKVGEVLKFLRSALAMNATVNQRISHDIAGCLVEHFRTQPEAPAAEQGWGPSYKQPWQAIEDATQPEVCGVEDGDYVLATKYADGDPGDQWAVGFYDGQRGGRHYVIDAHGSQFRGNGFRRVQRIEAPQGRYLLDRRTEIEASGRSLWDWLAAAPAAPVVDDAMVERLAQQAYEVHSTTPVGQFPNDDHWPKWRAVVRMVAAALSGVSAPVVVDEAMVTRAYAAWIEIVSRPDGCSNKSAMRAALQAALAGKAQEDPDG